jgi:hypothetical protein
MKKNLILIPLLISIILILTACDPASYQFNLQELEENVVAVQLVDYDNANPKIAKKRSEVLPYDFNRETQLKTLEGKNLNEFISRMGDTWFMGGLRYSNAPVGMAIKIIYKNGDFIILSSNWINDTVYGFVAKIHADGIVFDEMWSFMDRADYVDLVYTYFGVKIK